MPRTVEHIVACHEAATALRKAGKRIWNYTIDIKSILHEDQGNVTPEHISAISVRIAALIRSRIPAGYFDVTHDNFDFDFVDAVECMEQCTVADLAQDKANGVEAVDMLNQWLETVYDWADKNRVWVGL